MIRQFGLAALTVLELSSADQVSTAVAAGYDCVGLRLIPVAGQAVVHPLDIAEVEKRLADSDLYVLDVEVFRLDAQTRVADFELERAKLALAATQRLLEELS